MFVCNSPDISAFFISKRVPTSEDERLSEMDITDPKEGETKPDSTTLSVAPPAAVIVACFRESLVFTPLILTLQERVKMTPCQ